MRGNNIFLGNDEMNELIMQKSTQTRERSYYAYIVQTFPPSSTHSNKEHLYVLYSVRMYL